MYRYCHRILSGGMVRYSPYRNRGDCTTVGKGLKMSDLEIALRMVGAALVGVLPMLIVIWHEHKTRAY